MSYCIVCVQYLEKFQGIKFQEPVWFKAGAVILNEPLNYLGQDNLVGARSILATLGIQVSPSVQQASPPHHPHTKTNPHANTLV